MEKEIKVIKDRDVLRQLYTSLFTKYNIFLKAKDLNIQVKLVKYENERLYLRIADENYSLTKSVIYIRHNEEVVFSHIKPLSREGDVFIFKPESIQVLASPRKEERKKVESANAQSVIITNIISDFVIAQCLDNQKRKAEYIRVELLKKVGETYTNKKVFFYNEGPSDERMKFFYNKRKPFFIPDTTVEDNFTQDEDHMFFKNNIFEKDSIFSQDSLISEVSVPFLFKMMIPFGYLQINSKASLTEEAFSEIKKIGISTSELLSQDSDFIVTSDDKFTVSDLSMNGLGIMFKERMHIKHFKENSYLYFNLILPDKKQASMLCYIRNINQIDKVYKVGCEIDNIDPIGEVHYEEFLAAL